MQNKIQGLREFFSQKHHLRETTQFAWKIYFVDLISTIFLGPWIFRILQFPLQYKSLFSAIFYYFCSVPLFVILLMRHYKLSFSEIGFRFPSFLRSLLLTLCGFTALFLVHSVWFFKLFKSGPLDWNYLLPEYVITALLIAPFIEEVFYRGCLQTIFFKYWKSKVKAVLVVSLLFSFGHFRIKTEQDIKGRKGYAFQLNLLPESLVYGSFYFLSGNSLIVPILLHSFDNAVILYHEAKRPHSQEE